MLGCCADKLTECERCGMLRTVHLNGGRGCVFLEEWWVAHDEVVGLGLVGEVSLLGYDAVAPWRCGEVLACLNDGFVVDINGGDVCLRVSLGHHQRYESRTGTHIEDGVACLARSPCTEQHPVGTYTHAATVVLHRELLESKRRHCELSVAN